jgi:hypothetical protein
VVAKKKSKPKASFSFQHPLYRAAVKNRADRRNVMLMREKSLGSYFTADSKSSASLYERELKVIDDEMALLKAAAREAFGLHSIRITLFEHQSWTATGAGLLNAVLPVDASGLTEFASCAALFDEFREVGGECVITPCNCAQMGVSAVPQSLIVYDPADNGVIASVQAGMQIQQHELVNQAMITSNAVFVPGRVHTFKYRVPNDILQDVNVVGSSWQTTTVSPALPYGWHKSYASGMVAGNVVFSTYVKHHMEFRCRT